jgi:serine protease AprX
MALRDLADEPETSLFLIVEIDRQLLGHDEIRTEERIDRQGRVWKYSLFTFRPKMQSLIAERSVRVVHNNLGIIPAMCVEAKVRDIKEIARETFVKQIELSTKAKLSIRDSILLVKASEVWPSAKGAGVLVSVIDTGINDIALLTSKVKSSHDWTFEGEQDTYLAMDTHGHYEHGHGTSVASIIAHVAPDAQLLNYKAIHPFVGKAGSSPDKGNVIDAIRESVMIGADVINLSLGFDPSQCPSGHCNLCNAVHSAVSAGLNVVAAVGNEGKSPPDCPSQSREAISVGASTKSDLVAEFSSMGPTNDGRDKPDVVAPGNAMWIECSNHGHESRDGTSYSTALVSGIVALCRKKTTVPQDIKDALISKAIKLTSPDTGAHYHRHIQGEGRIDAKATYDYL